jgi:hypothetical protein
MAGRATPGSDLSVEACAPEVGVSTTGCTLSRSPGSTLWETLVTLNDAPHREHRTVPVAGTAFSYSVRMHSGHRHAYPDETNSTSSAVGLLPSGGNCAAMPSGLGLKLEIRRLEDVILGADLHHHLPERFHLAEIVRQPLPQAGYPARRLLGATLFHELPDQIGAHLDGGSALQASKCGLDVAIDGGGVHPAGRGIRLGETPQAVEGLLEGHIARCQSSQRLSLLMLYFVRGDQNRLTSPIPVGSSEHLGISF